VISINIYEIIFQMINFFILLMLMKKFLLTPLSGYLKKRVEDIEFDINKAEECKSDAEALLNNQKELLKEARLDAKAIRKDAEAATEKERSSLSEKAKIEAAQLIVQAKKDIEHDIANAKRQLTEDVSELVVSLSEKVLKNKLTEDDKKTLIQEGLGKI
jgi:F-type H+-transporting ATPase subunit b